MNQCTSCGVTKQPADFYKTNKSRCKTCCSAASKAWQVANRERYLALLAKFRNGNPDYDLRWKAENREAHQDHNTKCLYQISRAQRDAILAEQGGVCAICAGTNLSGKRLAIDHDHATAKVRGILCTGCNLQLGALEKGRPFRPKHPDHQNLQQRAIDYLTRSVI